MIVGLTWLIWKKTSVSLRFLAQTLIRRNLNSEVLIFSPNTVIRKIIRQIFVRKTSVLMEWRHARKHDTINCSFCLWEFCCCSAHQHRKHTCNILGTFVWVFLWLVLACLTFLSVFLIFFFSTTVRKFINKNCRMFQTADIRYKYS